MAKTRKMTEGPIAWHLIAYALPLILGNFFQLTYNAVNRVDDFACIPEQSISSAMMTCVAQNRGAGKLDRVKEMLRRGMLLEGAYGVCILLLVPRVGLTGAAWACAIGWGFMLLYAYMRYRKVARRLE